MAKDINTKQPIKDGDWNITFSDEQHVEDLLMTSPGHVKDSPLTGVGIVKYINAPLSPRIVSELERNIKLQIEADGAKGATAKVLPDTQSIETNGTYN